MAIASGKGETVLSDTLGTGNHRANDVLEADRAVHDWYRFVLSFPPHLVRHYLNEFELARGAAVLDPFCGTGTTVIEAKKMGFRGVGIEANPMTAFAATTKMDWAVDSSALLRHAQSIAQRALDELRRSGVEDEPLAGQRARPTNLKALDEDQAALIIENSISPLPLHKILVLRDLLQDSTESEYHNLELLSLARTTIASSNLRFGPEVGLGPVQKDAWVVGRWLDTIRQMANDLAPLTRLRTYAGRVHLGDARDANEFMKQETVDAVFTSPPYPNEKDYTRTTRLESVILGFLKNRADLRAMKEGLLRSNTRTVFKSDTDDRLVQQFPEIGEIAAEIERRRVELGKNSGFERLYPRVTLLYFGGMLRHLKSLTSCLKPGALAAYVVGDQASYLRVTIRTGSLLGQIAESLGYDVVRTDLFRTRFATATSAQLREEILLLRWRG